MGRAYSVAEGYFASLDNIVRRTKLVVVGSCITGMIVLTLLLFGSNLLWIVIETSHLRYLDLQFCVRPCQAEHSMLTVEDEEHDQSTTIVWPDSLLDAATLLRAASVVRAGCLVRLEQARTIVRSGYQLGVAFLLLPVSVVHVASVVRAAAHRDARSLPRDC